MMLHLTIILHALLTFLPQQNAAAEEAGCVSSAQCECLPAALRCRALSALSELPPAPAARALEVRDSELPVLDAAQLRRLPALRELRLVNCSVAALAGRWSQRHLELLDLSGNQMSEFRLEWLDGLPALRTLNLSSNPLQTVVGYRPVEEALVALDLSHGRWNCTARSLAWLHLWQRDGSRRLLRPDAARCSETRPQYKTMDGRRVLDVLRLMAATRDRCPSERPFGCSCELMQVEETAGGGGGDGGRAGPLTAVMVVVNCDGRGLTEFPPRLPDNTTVLYIRNNSLTDFGPVLGNHSGYQTLNVLYLDGNHLEAEDVNRLEGTDFIYRFTILSLARNRLQTLPLYAFDNAFQKQSFNVDSIFLGGNPWRCDCASPFTFQFRAWLMARNNLIRDRTEIRCGSGPLADTPPPGRALLTLSRRKLCGGVRVNWWDVANGLLAAAVLLMAAKFAYDVVVYRRTGKLPLVIRKFPC